MKGGEKKQGFEGEIASWFAIRLSKLNRKGAKLTKKHLKEARIRQEYKQLGWENGNDGNRKSGLYEGRRTNRRIKLYKETMQTEKRKRELTLAGSMKVI